MDAVTTHIYPAGMLNALSRQEVQRLQQASAGELYEQLRRCALAVMNSGAPSDDAAEMLEAFSDFSIHPVSVNRGLRLDLKQAPARAFVDGEMIRGIKELLSAVVRDLVHFHTELRDNPSLNLDDSDGITDAVFEIMRTARVLQPELEPNLVVCWGGHAIGHAEYEYSKDVGYQLGLRGMEICTGCGPGAMKGPMKGANVAHAKQRMAPGRHIGISEPGIIAAEPPNAIVNELVIMPDIEKRLEAFVRLGHGIVIFPGGVGTVEEILFVLSVLLDPANKEIPFPLVFTGPEASRAYFEGVAELLQAAVGDRAAERFEIIIDDPEAVARRMRSQIHEVRDFRIRSNDAFYFNWLLRVRMAVKQPFIATHENMAALNLDLGRRDHDLLVDLRRAFSGIVAGNVKTEGIERVRRHGPFELHGDPELMRALDNLLRGFVEQQRMRLPGHSYEPCYRIRSAA